MFEELNRRGLGIFRQLHVDEKEENEFMQRLNKLTGKKYKSITEFSDLSGISRTQLYALLSNSANPAFETQKKVSKESSLPVYVVAGILANEIKLDDEEAIILKSQTRIKYRKKNSLTHCNNNQSLTSEFPALF